MSSTTHANPPALVVGTRFGAQIHVPALRAACFDVVGLVGTNAERTARQAEANGIAQSFVDLDEAIRKTGAVAVTIASPPSTHAELTLKAIAHGCHVICEKPMASTVDEAYAMLRAAESAGITHLMGNQFRWQPERATVTRAINDGLIGEPRFLTLAGYFPLVASPEAKMPDWWFDPGAGGGWLGAHGSHLIDQVRSWLGEFASLSAALPTVSDRRGGAEDSYALRFRLANGVEGILQYTAGAWGAPADMVRVAGTQGTIWSEKGVVHVADRNGVRELAVLPDLVLPPSSGDKNARSAAVREPGPYIRLCEVLRAGVDGREFSSAVPPPTFHDGVACMEVMDAIRESAKNDGARVTLPGKHSAPGKDCAR
jgi:predicted dehydrogenase